MSGYVFAMSGCLRCGRPFIYNPNLVPSIRVRFDETAGGFVPDPQGHREPICEPCFHTLNALRQTTGVPAWPDPLPGAYEPLPEEEL